MKQWKGAIVSLILAALLSALPTAMAASPENIPVRGYLSTPDFTMLRWYAESADQRVESEGYSDGSIDLAVTAAPGTAWTLGATYTRVRDDQLLPYMGNEDVSGYCTWESDALQLDGATVTLPREAGAYTLTGTFQDDEGNAFACELVFNVSEEYFDVSSDPAYQERTDTATTVGEKVAQIVAECRQQGFTDEYHIALWLHDWLIYHANYDYTYSNYNADGVLLLGTGVCDSYSKAYVLLLNEFGIANKRVISEEMNHAWNLVKIDGAWCHVDCTWDDPGTGGNETHTYFGMSAALMGRDHQWITGDYPAATTLDNYYPVREGYLCFSTDEELDAILTAQATAKASPISLAYIGLDADQNGMSMALKWFSAYNWKYGLGSYSFSGSEYFFDITVKYTSPWDEPEETPEVTLPVDAPDFDLDSPQGRYLMKNYANNGILLIVGRTTCGNTRSLLSRLSNQQEDLYARGIEILVMMNDASNPEDLDGIESEYPGYHYTYYNSSVASNYYAAAGSSGSGYYPDVYVVDRQGMLTYYHSGFVTDLDELIAQLHAVATNYRLPEPEKHFDLSEMLNGTGNVNNITNGETIVTAVQSAAKSGNVLYVTAYWPQNVAGILSYYEKHYSMFEKLKLSVVAAIYNIEGSDKADYPHCTFVDYSNRDFWSMLRQAGDTSDSASYTTNMLILKGGDIVAYTNGSTLSGNQCALCLAQRIQYEASVPAALTEIKEESFSGTSFKSVDLTNGSLKTIRANAFAGCGGLDYVRIPETVETIEDGAFRNVSDAVLICTIGSEGYRYARANGLDYICE